jgi:hypothetical protein
MHLAPFTDLQILWLVLSYVLLILSWALLRPRSLFDVADQLISGSALSRGLRRRFIIATACHVLSVIGFFSFFWQNDSSSHRLIVVLSLLIGIALLPEVLLRWLASFMPTVHFVRFRRHKWGRKLGGVFGGSMVLVTALLIFWFIYPDAAPPR